MSSDSPRTRADGADGVTDVLHDLSPLEATMLAQALVVLRLVEQDVDCQESQLHALAEVAEWHPVPRDAVAQLRYLDAATVVGSQVEYLDFLLGPEG